MDQAPEDQDALREIADYERSPERARAQESALLDDQVKKWREAQGLALNYVGDALQHDKMPGAAAQSPTDPLIQQAQQDLQDYRAATQREVDAKRKQAEAMAPEYQKYIDQSRAYRENPLERPQVPNLPAQPPTLQQQVNPTAAKSLFAVASMMAALSMAGGRGRGMLAMAGMTGAIQGFNEGNFLKYKTGMETYKTAVDTQIQQYNMQVKDYTLQMDQRHQNLEDMFRELNLQAHKYGDDVMIAETEAGRLDGILKRTADIAKFSNDAQRVVQENELFPYRRDLLQAQTEKAQAEARRGPQMSAEAQKILLARRAEGQTTGIPDIDALSPDNAKRMAGLDKATGDDKPAGPGNYFDKSQGTFVPQIPTRGELREEPNRYVRMSNQDRQAVEFLYSALDQIPQLEGLIKDISPTTSVGSGVMGLRAPMAQYTPGETATKIQDFKQRSSALTLEATRLETGTSRVLGAVLQKVHDQIPSPATNQKTALNQLKTLKELINTRLNSFLGTRGQDWNQGGGGAGGGGGQGKPPEVMRSKDVDGRPIWKLPNEKQWHYE